MPTALIRMFIRRTISTRTGQSPAMRAPTEMIACRLAVVARQTITVGPIVARPMLQLRTDINADLGIIRHTEANTARPGPMCRPMSAMMRGWLVSAGRDCYRRAHQQHQAKLAHGTAGVGHQAMAVRLWDHVTWLIGSIFTGLRIGSRRHALQCTYNARPRSQGRAATDSFIRRPRES